MRMLPAVNDFRRVLLLAMLAALSSLWFFNGRASGAMDNQEASLPDASALPAAMAPSIEQVPPVAQPSEQAVPPPAVMPVTVDIFSVRTWQPSAPVMPVDATPVPPPKPQAPPLPFRFLGKIDEPGKDTAYLLARSDQVLSVSVGESIGRTYLVEKHEGNRLYFIYKPLKVRQSIFVGSKS